MPFKLFRNKAAQARLEAARRAEARAPTVPPSQADPTRLRAPERPQDQALMAHTTAWVESLPAGIRPRLLLELYPRVANRLALCWNEKALTNRLFEDLLVDRRGGRKGFPAGVKAELLQLRLAYPRVPLTDTSRTPHWDLHSQALSDR